MKFEYDAYIPDSATDMSGHDRLNAVFADKAGGNKEDIWHKAVDDLAVNLRDLTDLLGPIAPLVAAGGDNGMLGEFECLTMPGAVHWFVEGNYLELLHHYVEARVCIDITKVPLTDAQRNEARRLYCHGYMSVMRMCVNLYGSLPGRQMEYAWIPDMIEHTSHVYSDLYNADPPMLSPMSPYFVED